METELIIAIIAGLGGMLGWGLADLFAKKTIDTIGDMSSLLWAHIFGTGILFLVFLYKALTGDVVIPQSFSEISLLIAFGALQAMVYLFVYRGFGKGQVSILNPVFASFSGITALISILVLGEIVTNGTIYGLIFIFLGIILLNLDPESLKSRKLNFVKVAGFQEVAVATILAAVWTLGWDRFIGGKDWVTYAFFMYLFMTVVIFIVVKNQKTDLKISKNSIWFLLFIIGLCETVAYLAISWGYETTTKTSVVALLSGAFSLPTIILARTFLKERATISQLFGGFVIIAGIILLSVL